MIPHILTNIPNLCQNRVASKKDKMTCIQFLLSSHLSKSKRVFSQMTSQLKTIISMILGKPAMLPYIIKEVLQTAVASTPNYVKETHFWKLKEEKKN